MSRYSPDSGSQNTTVYETPFAKRLIHLNSASVGTQLGRHLQRLNMLRGCHAHYRQLLTCMRIIVRLDFAVPYLAASASMSDASYRVFQGASVNLTDARNGCWPTAIDYPKMRDIALLDSYHVAMFRWCVRV